MEALIRNGNRGNHQRCFITKIAFKNFAIFTGKDLCLSLFLIKSFKKRIQRRCFPVNIAIFLKALILKNIGKQLFLSKVKENPRKPYVFFFVLYK